MCGLLLCFRAFFGVYLGTGVFSRVSCPRVGRTPLLQFRIEHETELLYQLLAAFKLKQ